MVLAFLSLVGTHERKPLASGLSRVRRVVHLALRAGAALEQGDRGRDRLGPGNRPGDDDRRGRGRHPPRPLGPARAGAGTRLPGDGHPWRQGQDHAVPRRPRPGPFHRCQVGGRPRLRAPSARAQAGPGEPGAARLLRGRLRARAHAARRQRLPRRQPTSCSVHLFADRPWSRPARHRDRPRDAPARAGPADRLARPGPGHAGARGRGRERPPGQRPPRQRVEPHRVGVGRARPALLRRAAPHGRDPRRQLHALPRRRARRALRPLDRR